MRVNEKYSTLPAEDRSVHIINICAIEDIGYLPSEGTVSAGGRDRAGGPRTCAAPGESSTGMAAPRGARDVGGASTRARGNWRPTSTRSALYASEARRPPGHRGVPDRPLGSASWLASPPLCPGPGVLALARGLGPGWDTPFPLVPIGAAEVGVGGSRIAGGGWQPLGPSAPPPSGDSCDPLGLDPLVSPSPARGVGSSQSVGPGMEFPTPRAAGGRWPVRLLYALVPTQPCAHTPSGWYPGHVGQPRAGHAAGE